jgi:hypothetical protein
MHWRCSVSIVTWLWTGRLANLGSVTEERKVFFPMWEGEDRETCAELQIISAGINNDNREIQKQNRNSTAPYTFNEVTFKFSRTWISLLIKLTHK